MIESLMKMHVEYYMWTRRYVLYNTINEQRMYLCLSVLISITTEYLEKLD